jgi:hypothetical protein
VTSAETARSGARVRTILLPARYEVEAILEAGEQPDLGRIVLEVGVGRRRCRPAPRGIRRLKFRRN